MKGEDLERAAASCLQTGGWFVLRNPTDPSFQAFEIDALGYRFGRDWEERVILEAKGGKSRFGALWKLLGLKTHLGVDHGVLLADPTDKHNGLLVQSGTRHGIYVIDQENTTLDDHLLETPVVDFVAAPEVREAWQRCYRIEDALIKVINDKDLWGNYSTIRLAKQQMQQLVTRVWMETDPWRQAIRLYRLYVDEPKIVRRMVREIDPLGADQLFRRAMYDGALREVQACFYLEHRKRLAVAFAATRCAAVGTDDSRWRRLAPYSFSEMVATIGEEDAWYLPAVLQTYFVGFGGMICLDAADTEYGYIAAQSGCTPKQARRSLHLFEELFPNPSGWYYTAYDLERLKLMPVPVRGAGVAMREVLYEGEWSDLATEDQWRVVGQETIDSTTETEALLKPRSESRDVKT